MEAEQSKLKPQNVIDVDLANNNVTRLLKIVMIYGANASGKTNLIRALFYLINFIIKKPKVDDKIILAETFLFDKSYSDQNTEFELVFIGPKNVKYTYKIVLNRDQVEKEELYYYPNGKVATLFTRAASNSDPGSNIHIGILGGALGKREIKVFKNQLFLSKFGDDEPLEELTSVFLYFKKYTVINATSHEHRKRLEIHASHLFAKDNDLSAKLNSLLRFADTKLKEVVVESRATPGKEDSATSGASGVRNYANPYSVVGLHDMYQDNEVTGELAGLSFDNESTGTQVLYALGISVLLTLREGGTLIVDELDTSLHPFLTIE